MFNIKIGIVRFVSTPTGGAPENIRKSWIGVEVPCFYYQERPSTNYRDGAYDIATRKKQPFYKSYVIPQKEAIEALRAQNPEAADWWNKNGFPNYEGALFSFNEECVLVLEPVMTREEFIAYGEQN